MRSIGREMLARSVVLERVILMVSGPLELMARARAGEIDGVDLADFEVGITYNLPPTLAAYNDTIADYPYDPAAAHAWRVQRHGDRA